MPCAMHQTGMGQNAKMSRECVLGHGQQIGELTYRDSVWFMGHEITKRVEPRCLCKRSKNGDSFNCIHISRLIDI